MLALIITPCSIDVNLPARTQEMIRVIGIVAGIMLTAIITLPVTRAAKIKLCTTN